MAEQTAISHALKLSHLLIKSQSNSNSRHIKEF